MPYYNSNEALFDAIGNDMYEIFENISDNINSTMKENIAEIVYAPHESGTDTPRRTYEKFIRRERGGFLGSWVVEGARKDDYYSSQFLIYSEPELMDYSPPVHGLGAEEGEEVLPDFEVDRRPIMDRVIAEGTDFDYYVDQGHKNSYGPDDNWWTRPRDYFTPTLEFVEQNLKYIIEENFKELNIAYK